MNQSPYRPNLAEIPADFDGQLPVTEIFHSVQGEGRWVGWPAIFIRLAYCNLGCVWCDTRFTWDKSRLDSGSLLSAKEIARRALELAGEKAGATHIVLTGGEPMLHQRSLPGLIDELSGVGFSFFEMETNGTIEPSEQLRARISWWNCSPKLSNSELNIHETCVPAALTAIAATGRADFKFVIRSHGEIDELLSTYGQYVNRESIMLMPEGSTASVQLAAMPAVIEACRQHGFRFSPRFHILAWGNQRGK
jgi:7-carboxy-7-deazaguanine synthase